MFVWQPEWAHSPWLARAHESSRAGTRARMRAPTRQHSLKMYAQITRDQGSTFQASRRNNSSGFSSETRKIRISAILCKLGCWKCGSIGRNRIRLTACYRPRIRVDGLADVRARPKHSNPSVLLLRSMSPASQTPPLRTMPAFMYGPARLPLTPGACTRSHTSACARMPPSGMQVCPHMPGPEPPPLRTQKNRRCAHTSQRYARAALPHMSPIGQQRTASMQAREIL